MESVQELAPVTGVSRACRALGVARSTLYRSIRPASEPEPLRPRPKPDRALSEPERQEVLAQLHSERFVDRSPGEVHATLLDEGRFLCSVRTMYRIFVRHINPNLPMPFGIPYFADPQSVQFDEISRRYTPDGCWPQSKG